MNWKIVGFVALPSVGGLATTPVINTQYAWLKKPTWTPPNWAFARVWTSLYCSMGYASYLVYRDGDGLEGAAKLPLMIYGTNLLTNWAWRSIFFSGRSMKLALFEIQIVNVTALGMLYHFYEINPVAGYLVVPYVLWMGLATVLNYVIYRNNKPKLKRKKKV